MRKVNRPFIKYFTRDWKLVGVICFFVIAAIMCFVASPESGLYSPFMGWFMTFCLIFALIASYVDWRKNG